MGFKAKFKVKKFVKAYKTKGFALFLVGLGIVGLVISGWFYFYGNQYTNFYKNPTSPESTNSQPPPSTVKPSPKK